MKLRQKLAVLLAASMVATAMPVVTMAKSDNNLTKSIQIGEKDAAVATTTGLKIEMKDATAQEMMFFVNIQNAEFDTTTSGVEQTLASSQITDVSAGTLDVKYTVKDEGKEMVVRLIPSTSLTGTFVLPLNVILKGGDATVSVDGAGSVISDLSPVVFARTSDTKAKVTVEDAEAIYAESKKVAKITIEEPFKNIIGKGTAADQEIEFSIRHSDYEFDAFTVKGEKGFSKYTTVAQLGDFVTTSDNGVIKFKPNAANLTNTTAPGRLVFEFTLDTSEKTPATGKVDIKVDSDNVDGATVTVAEVKAYGTEIEMDDKKVVDVTAGNSEEITFTLKEVVADTFSANREFDIVFDKAFLAPREDGAEYGTDDKYTLGANDEFDADDYLTSILTTSKLDGLVYQEPILDEDDYIVGFTAKMPASLDPEEDEFEIKDLEVFTALGTSGEVKVTASGRALGDEASTAAINIKEAVTVKAEPMTIKVGLKEQTGGKLVITEADKGIIKQGEYIYVKIDDGDDTDSLKLKDTDLDEKIEVTSGDLVLDVDSYDVKSGVLSMKVKRESTEASTITISDLTVYADRTVPQGTYDVKVGGTALTDVWSTTDTSTIKDFGVDEFIIVGTANTEDITSNGLKKGTASFVIGSTKYIVNGVEVEADGAAYLDNGRTMVPVRFVANALGVDSKDIYFADGTATIIAGNKTVSVKVGSKTAMLNGVAARTMTAAPVVKDGRTYVPVAEIGALLGVEATWDAATQTATFTNK